MNSKNIHELKQFFEENEGLTNAQLAMLANISISTIIQWKRRCGIIKTPPRGVKEKTTTEPIPENWDNKEWFEQAYEKMGLRAIACLIGKGKNWLFVARRLKKYGIPRKTAAERSASKNPCCDEEWLHYYYADRKTYLKWCRKNKIASCKEGGQRLSALKCAELAGVSSDTIACWLTLYKMEIRGISEAQTGLKIKKNLSVKTKREHRDRFFRLYRSGKMNLIFGSKRYSNGKEVDREETIIKRFGKRVRRTPSHSSGDEKIQTS